MRGFGQCEAAETLAWRPTRGRTPDRAGVNSLVLGEANYERHMSPVIATHSSKPHCMHRC